MESSDQLEEVQRGQDASQPPFHQNRLAQARCRIQAHGSKSRKAALRHPVRSFESQGKNISEERFEALITRGFKEWRHEHMALFLVPRLVYHGGMLTRFLRSLSHALHGVRTVWKEEPNFRLQSVTAVAVLAFLAYFRFTYSESAIIVFSMMLVLGAEMFNTLVEDLLDVIEPEHHASVGKMKDMMAGVVLLMSCGAVLVGVLVAAHHFRPFA